MQPEPSGERCLPPHILTAIGTAEAGDRLLCLAVRNKREESLLSTAFERMGWRVEIARSGLDLLRLVLTFHLKLVITDKPLYFLRIRHIAPIDQLPRLLVIADEQNQKLEQAWAVGAEGVMVRSIDEDNFFNYAVVMRDDA